MLEQNKIFKYGVVVKKYNSHLGILVRQGTKVQRIYKRKGVNLYPSAFFKVQMGKENYYFKISPPDGLYLKVSGFFSNPSKALSKVIIVNKTKL